MLEESDILYWINLISVPHDEWTDDTARIAMELSERWCVNEVNRPKIIRDEETRKNYNYYSERRREEA